MDGSLDLAALRKLRDASGALKELFGDSEDPRQWKKTDGGRIVTVSDGLASLARWGSRLDNNAGLLGAGLCDTA